MENFERLYDEVENAHVRFIGFTMEHTRYDFGILFTRKFFGKPLVICMQTGRATTLCADEAANVDYIQQHFAIQHREDAEFLSHFFQQILPSVPMESEY